MSTVLIAGGEHLAPMKARREFADALSFADTEALRALDVITRQRPQVVALERMFAATSRGAALINRIKADPSLGACEIRIVALEIPSTPQAPVVAPVADAGSPVVPAKAPLDRRGTRRAPRFDVAEGLEILADGNPAALVNISLVGAQVVSPTILKPNQRLRIALPDSERPLRFNGVVAWAAFEMPKGGPRYRAGIEFFDADPSWVQRFIDASKT